MDEPADAVIMVEQGAPPPTPTKDRVASRSPAASGTVNEGRAMVQLALEFLSKSRDEIQRLKRAVTEQGDIINGQ
ncbi:hypothetical protein HRG_012585 [Hirsutella rhossiliensis]